MKKKNLIQEVLKSKALEIVAVIVGFLLIFDFIITPFLTYKSTIFNLAGLIIMIITMASLFYYIKKQLEKWIKKPITKKSFENKENK